MCLSQEGSDKKMLDSGRSEEDDAVMDADEPRNRTRTRWIWAGVLALFGGVLLLWFVREPIARSYVDSLLAERQVDASYRITHFGFREQKLENLVVGDPANPDLLVRKAILRFGWSGSTPGLLGVEADGVRLNVAVRDGKLVLGQLDRLLPEPDGRPFVLPDLYLRLHDARARIDTPGGRIGVAIDGAGRLSNGFSGQLAAISERLELGGCGAVRPTIFLHVATVGGRPALDGPLRMARLRCGAVEVNKPETALDIMLGEDLVSWNGGARFATEAVRSGAYSATALRGRLTFRGDARATDARLRASVTGVRTPDLLPALDATPLAPFANALSEAGRVAARAADIDAALHLGAEQGGRMLRVGPLAIASRGGARLEFAASGRDGIAIRLPDGAMTIDGRLALSGGGLPEAVVNLAGHGGTVHMRPWQVPGGRLLLEQVRFDRGGLRGRLLIDGPLGDDGRIEGLALPLDMRRTAEGRMVLNPGCSPLSFRALSLAGIEAGPTRLTLCAPASGLGEGVVVEAPALAGTLGDESLRIGAASLRFDARRQAFVLASLAVRLGDSRLDVARIDGGVAGGHFAGASGKLEAVPLLISEGNGTWTLEKGALRLGGRIAVDDANSDARFYRLNGEDVVLTVKDGAIAVTGTLRSPISPQTVTHVRIDHDLGQGSGRALLDVPGLRFAPDLQPENLTRLTLGVVANVNGAVKGQGRIYWDRNGVRSDGDFSADSIDLAAAFGPVSRLSGKIHFSDLLEMVTPPGQEVRLGEVNPGVAVIDGVVRYQLLPGQVVRIESGRWPFSGGQLLLDPTTLDFGRPSERPLTFRIEGMDSALFVEQFDFRNISVSGVFDGVLPMVFDAQGGRIENGRLVVRKGGGTVAYVGPLSNEDLGRFAGMAFDALKSIRYDNLAIEMNGSLDGELVSRVLFNGVNKAPVGEKRELVKRFTNLPFRFNITITAPFRSLLNSAQAINDPRGLVQGALERERAAALVQQGFSR